MITQSGLSISCSEDEARNNFLAPGTCSKRVELKIKTLSLPRIIVSNCVIHLTTLCPSTPLSSGPGTFPCPSPQCSSSSPSQICKSSWPLPPQPCLSASSKALTSVHFFRSPATSSSGIPSPLTWTAVLPLLLLLLPLQSILHRSQPICPQSVIVISTWLPLALCATHAVQVSATWPFVSPVSRASEYATSMGMEALFIFHPTQPQPNLLMPILQLKFISPEVLL